MIRERIGSNGRLPDVDHVDRNDRPMIDRAPDDPDIRS